MARSTAIHHMLWEKDGTLLEETHGGIVHDGSEGPQLLFARQGEELIPLTYNHDEIVQGTRGIRKLFVDEEVDTGAGYEVQISIGGQPLGLEVLGENEGKLTIDKPVETTFLYAISKDKSLSCEYKGDQWYWLYSEGKVIMRKELSGQLPTQFKFEPANN